MPIPRIVTVAALAALGLTGCRPSDVLSVPPPIGTTSSGSLANESGAEAQLAGATSQLYQIVGQSRGLVEMSELLTDEFTWAYYRYVPTYAAVDARYTEASGIATNYPEVGGGLAGGLLGARSSLLIAEVGLAQYEPAAGQSKVGEAYALAGYAELFLAEDFCAGVPLSIVLPAGGVQYGNPLTTDSLLGVAEAHFTTALAQANGNDSVIGLASVGLGRALLDRGQFAQAAAAVASVPTGFLFNMVYDIPSGSTNNINVYMTQLPAYLDCGEWNIGNQEGGTGLNFVSAGDPRLVIDSTEKTCDGRDGAATPGTFYYPTKFGNPSTTIPLATGVEARLIAAEAALQGGNVSTAVADLNALRVAAPSTYLQLASPVPTMTTDPTGVDSLNPTTTQAADILFRERAFWLYGLDTRLGDLRRLIRQYGRDQGTVFPSGAFANGNSPYLPTPLPTYGTDVSISLPTQHSTYSTTNPNYHGCLSSPGTA